MSLLKGILGYLGKSVTKTDADKQIWEGGEEVNYSTSSQNRSWNGLDVTD